MRSHHLTPVVRRAATDCMVALLVEHLTCNQEIFSLTLSHTLLHSNLGQVVHTHVPSVTKQYNLVW